MTKNPDIVTVVIRDDDICRLGAVLDSDTAMTTEFCQTGREEAALAGGSNPRRNASAAGSPASTQENRKP